VIAAMKELWSSPRGFIEAYYFESTRADALLAACAEGPLFAWREAGRVMVNVDEVATWLAGLAVNGDAPATGAIKPASRLRATCSLRCETSVFSAERSARNFLGLH
jgi:hypothetical protein